MIEFFDSRQMTCGEFVLAIGLAFMVGALASAWVCESFRDKYRE